jgi:hypothetical protein
VIDGANGTIFRSIVAESAATESIGTVVGHVIARDRAGHTLGSTPVTASNPDVPPFMVALPATTNVASLELRGVTGDQPLAVLKASRHAPKGRFDRLPKSAPRLARR